MLSKQAGAPADAQAQQAEAPTADQPAVGEGSAPPARQTGMLQVRRGALRAERRGRMHAHSPAGGEAPIQAAGGRPLLLQAAAAANPCVPATLLPQDLPKDELLRMKHKVGAQQGGISCPRSSS